MSDALSNALAWVERLQEEQRKDIRDVNHFRALARTYMDERDDARGLLGRCRGALEGLDIRPCPGCSLREGHGVDNHDEGCPWEALGALLDELAER